jgi:PHD-finger
MGIALQQGNDDLSEFAHNIREAAMLELARLNYDMETLKSDFARNLKPSDGSDWSKEQKEKFHFCMFRFRRNLHSVAKAMDVSMNTCHAYYLGTYKSTPEYLLLKTICVDERNGKLGNSQHSFDVCCVCGDGGSLIICDGCEGEYHMACLQPQLRRVPEGHWLCDECVDRNLLEARDILFRRSKFFEKVGASAATARKRTSDELITSYNDESNPSTSVENFARFSKVSFCPSSHFIDAASVLSSKIEKLLSNGGE